MKTTIEKSKYFTDFEKRCLLNEYHGAKEYTEIWSSSNNINQFIDKIKNDMRVNKKQATMLIASREKNFDVFLNGLLKKAKIYKYVCDVGSLKIGNDKFTTLIPNGYGDGEHSLYIIDNDNDIDFSWARFMAVVEGDFNIYEHDCGNEILISLSGKYFVKVYDGLVFLIRF